jgi:predicted molibdopterin-dependent oxidoreductase YjgC
MFKRVFAPPAPTVSVTVEGRPVAVAIGDSVAAAVLAAGFNHTRTSPVSGCHRGPYCMMGVCFECLVEIDGIPNRQACMTPVREGMHIKLQQGARGLDT